MRLFFIISVLGILVSSCAKPHPKMLSFTPASVVIDYTGNDLHSATSLAQQFCSSIGKDAQYVSDKIENGFFASFKLAPEQHAFFNCVESHSKALQQNQHHNGGSSMNPVIINNKQ